MWKAVVSRRDEVRLAIGVTAVSLSAAAFASNAVPAATGRSSMPRQPPALGLKKLWSKFPVAQANQPEARRTNAQPRASITRSSLTTAASSPKKSSSFVGWLILAAAVVAVRVGWQETTISRASVQTPTKEETAT